MTTPSRPEGTPDPTLVFGTLSAYQRTAALRAAIEIDLFRALGEGLGDVAGLARRLKASERGIRILCDALTVLGLITKSGERYAHSATSALFLDPASPACLAATARFMTRPEVRGSFDQLAEAVRNGRTALPGAGTVEPENPIWVEFAHSMAPMMGAMAVPLAAIVAGDRKGPIRILDIAAGHGLFGIAFARQNREARITAVDWAPVLEVAKANARKAEVADRLDTIPGSAFDVPFGGPYDVALLTNFLHHFDRATCVGLLRKVHAALAPGGVVAALEFVPNEDRISPEAPALFSLVMLATTATGDAYTGRELESMYVEAGFGKVEVQPVPDSPETVVTGRKG
ncbi:MAG TPA: class I SAM-dependent methyltransferase [Dongiaceae bacterium]|nr:class I SAM-dependent methyltransferase [Dongiaceae bacterium]